MNRWTAHIGKLRFELSHAEFRPMGDLPCAPFLVMQDGTAVGIMRRGHSSVLVVDHRPSPGGVARVETWRCLDQPEGPLIEALLVLADAARPTQHNRARPGYTRRGRQPTS